MLNIKDKHTYLIRKHPVDKQKIVPLWKTLVQKLINIFRKIK